MSTSRLEIERTQRAGGWLIRLSGVVDDHVDRSAITRDVSGVVVFDLDGVTRITSFGVREWMTALKELRADYVAFVRCRPAMVMQFNMIADFGGAGNLISLYAPFLCPTCDEPFDVLLDLRQDFGVVASGSEPEAACPRCGAAGEFDDLPDAYFAYAGSRAPPVLPPIARQIIDGKADNREERFEAQKEIQGQLTAVWLGGALRGRARICRLLDGLEGSILVVCAGLTELHPDGLSALAESIEQPGASAWLARVRPQHVRFMQAHAPSLADRVITLLVSVECGVCERRHEFEIGTSAATKVRGFACLTCAQDVPYELSAEDRAAIEQIPEVPPSLEIKDYLRARPGASLEEARRTTSDTDTFDKYKIVQKIGVGGMAEIFLARQRGAEGFEKTIVLKRILPRLSEDKALIDMFLQEAHVAARVSHPNVVQILDLGKANGEFFIAMEYVRGWDLRMILEAVRRTDVRLPVELACRIISDVSAGLHAAHTCARDSHSHGIVHRDVSPRNILVSYEGAVKLTDFGIAKAEGTLHQTKPGTIKGKVNYMSPEQIQGQEVDARTDVFATGIVLFECLAGRRPFKGDASEYKAMMAIVREALPRIEDLRPDIPPKLANVVRVALERKPEHRYQSALLLHLELEGILVELGRPTTATHLGEWIQSKLVDSGALVRPPERSSSSTGVALPEASTSEVLAVPVKAVDLLREENKRKRQNE